MTEDRILTLSEVSDMTRIPVQTLRYWRSTDPAKGPKMFRLVGRVVAKHSDVLAWIESNYEASA